MNSQPNAVRVLLVEDDPVHRTIAERYLAKLSGVVELVAQAEDLEAARAEVAAASPPIDCVLLDLTLPDSAMESTLGTLPSLVDEWTARIIATSSLNDPEVVAAVRRAGATGFLPKEEISSESLRDLMVPRAPRAPAQATREAVIPARRPSTRSTTPPAAQSPDHDLDPTTARFQSIASRLAHDANSWITNASFRLAAVRGLVDRATEAVIGTHLEAIQTSLDALAATGKAARVAFNEETSPLDFEIADAISTLRTEAVDWQQGADPARVAAVFEGATQPVQTSPLALGWILAILAGNADAHGSSPAAGEPIRVRFEGDGERTVVISDDGGPWSVEMPDRLTEPAISGARGAPFPGMGLYRARRLMERMGGTLAVRPRNNWPDAFEVVLTFKAA